MPNAQSPETAELVAISARVARAQEANERQILLGIADCADAAGYRTINIRQDQDGIYTSRYVTRDGVKVSSLDVAKFDEPIRYALGLLSPIEFAHWRAFVDPQAHGSNRLSFRVNEVRALIAEHEAEMLRALAMAPVKPQPRVLGIAARG